MTETFEHIIIGAGSAGCVLANRLSTDPLRRVLLLEAGGPDRKPEIRIPGAYTKLNRTSVDWSFWTEEQEHVDGRRLYIPRGKTLGGSSSTNAMAYVRGNPADFDEWSALGNPGWSHSEVLPYFLRSEDNAAYGAPFHGKGGPLHVAHACSVTPLGEAFLSACAEEGVLRNDDCNGVSQMGASLLQFTIKGGCRHSAATAFLKPAMGRRNLTVRTRCLVLRILTVKGRAIGVEYIDGRGVLHKAMAGVGTVLCAGAIQSPQLLLLSGIGDAQTLSGLDVPVVHDLPGVGRNLQDHVWSGVSGFTNIPTGNHYLSPLRMTGALLRHLLLHDGPLANSPLEANAFLSTDSGATRPDLQLHMAPIAIAGDYSTDIHDLSTFPRRSGYGILAILLHPASRGYVGLRSGNPQDPPVIQPRFLSDARDMETLLAGLRKAIAISQSPRMRRHCPDGIHLPSPSDDEEGLRSHIRRSLETLYHPVGTCRMGDDAAAVVDAGLKVRGIDALHVADASVMPTIVSGNTNAATIMIGEKAADLLLS